MSEGYIESIDNVKSKTISIVRAIAMLSIVICHYVQCYENISWMGQFFNVGVSMFFLISGVLHGQKQIKNKMSWYKRKLLKILIPVYIYYIVMVIVLAAMGKIGHIDLRNLLSQLLSLDGFIGGGIGNMITYHLWFVGFILLCYLITPALQYINNRYSNTQKKLMICIVTVCEMILITQIDIRAYITWLSGVILYIVAYFFLSRYRIKSSISTLVASILIMIACIALRLSIKALADTYGGMIDIIYERIVASYTHAILACGIYYSVYFIVERTKIFSNRAMKVVGIIDKYSYYVYITHNMFLAGVLNVMGITNNFLINTILFTILMSFSALLLSKISSFVTKKLFKI